MNNIKNFDRKVEKGKIKFEKGGTGVLMLEEKIRLIDDESGETEKYWASSEWSSKQLTKLAEDQSRRKTDLLNQANDAGDIEKFINNKMLPKVLEVENAK